MITLIEKQEDLHSICKKNLRSSQNLYIDTEFTRTSTYYPIFALLQIAVDDGQIFIIDPLRINDWSCLQETFEMITGNVVLFSATQDLEVMQVGMSFVPKKIFDLQTAITITSYDSKSIGYSAAVKNFLNIDINKEHRRSDWLFRPLSSEQIDYAATDVLYLRPIYDKILQSLKDYENGIKLQWFSEDMNRFLSKYAHKEKQSAMNGMNTLFIHHGNFHKNYKYVLRFGALYIAREEIAKNLNKPRKYILSDYILHTSALNASINKNIDNNHRAIFEEALKSVSSLSKEEAFLMHPNLFIKGTLSKYQKEKLMSIRDEVAKTYQLSADYIFTKRQLKDAACGYGLDIFTTGWRGEIFKNAFE
jgi:ribonuclease D